MDGFVQDLRHGVRVLARSPGASGIAVLSLALGIGAATAIFSVERALLLAPLPYPEPDRLVAVWQRPPEQRWRMPLSGPDYIDYRERNRSFDELGVQALRPVNLSGEGTPERVWASLCTASFLRAVGVAPAVGRLFTDAEETQGERVLVLSHGLWKRRFGADPGIVGRRISLNRQTHTVVGVMPAGYETPRVWITDTIAELWTPVRLARADNERDGHWLAAIGRLNRGVSWQTGEEDLRGIAAALARQYPISNGRVSVWCAPLGDFMASDVRRPIWFLLAAVGVLLAISCANVASIQFTRSGARLAEAAIRSSLGAGRARVIRQHLTENLVLCGAGGAAGVWLAWWGTEVLRGMIPATIERASRIQIDGWVLLFSTGITLATVLLSGLAPALSASRLDINSALRGSQNTLTAGRSRSRFQNLLLVVQFGLALVLANSAALMLKSYLNALGGAAGFDTQRTLAAGLTLEGSAYQDAGAQSVFWNRLLDLVRTIPGVKQAAVTTKLPLNGGNNSGFLVEGEKYDPMVARPTVERSWITPEYFDAMGIPLLAGRSLAPARAAGSESEIVVNRAFARRYWPEGSALGKRVYPNAPVRDWAGVIVGVVEDVRQWGVETQPLPEIYFRSEMTARSTRHLIVRAGVPPMTLARAVREAVQSIDPEQPVSGIRSMEEVLSGSTAQRRFNTLLIQIFTGLALVMVAVGIYGVLSCHFAQRTREVGIRMALGAAPPGVVKMVIARGLALAALGICAGIGGVLALARIVGSMLYQVSPTHPGSIAVVIILLLLVSLVGSVLPALRAARVDPVRALRAE